MVMSTTLSELHMLIVDPVVVPSEVRRLVVLTVKKFFSFESELKLVASDVVIFVQSM